MAKTKTLKDRAENYLWVLKQLELATTDLIAQLKSHAVNHPDVRLSSTRASMFAEVIDELRDRPGHEDVVRYIFDTEVMYYRWKHIVIVYSASQREEIPLARSKEPGSGMDT